jgi:hypothetical protein
LLVYFFVRSEWRRKYGKWEIRQRIHLRGSGAVHADVNESGRGHVTELSDFFFADRPWYPINKCQRVLVPSNWFYKFREPVQIGSLADASVGHRCESNGMYCMSPERTHHKLSNGTKHV